IRWRVILRDERERPLPWLPLWHAVAIGFMANNLLPARAGEFARAYVASRQLPVRFTTALGSIGVERVFDALVMLGLMALAIASPTFPAHSTLLDTPLSRLAGRAALRVGSVFVRGVRVAGADRRISPAARDPRVRGGGPGVGRLLRRLRESDAADVAALRHQSEPSAGVRGRVSRFHVPAHHAARPALACECPPPPGRPGSGTDSRSTGGRETVTDAVRVAAHAKLNLLLRILAREAPAGYHQIETAFALLELTDELVVTRTATGVALTVHGPDLGAPEQNLAVRAARAVLGATGYKFGVALELTKRIPVRSGVGGGSSGAAARGPLLLAADAFTGWGSLGRLGGNDFELPVFGKHAPLRALYERLAGTHPYWVRLCGSGSAVAAVYANAGLRDDAAMLLGEKHQRLIKTTTRAAAAPGPEPA